MKTAPLLWSSLLVSLTATVGGCVAATTDDQAVTQSEVRASTVSEGYFLVTRRDPRECASALCGGWLVRRVNDSKGSCPSGETLFDEECYFSAINLSPIGLSAREEHDLRASMEAGHVIVRGRYLASSEVGVGTFDVTAAWLGATGSPPVGRFLTVKSNDAPCMRSVCPLYVASTLNVDGQIMLADVTLDQTRRAADDRKMKLVTERLHADGALLAGDLVEANFVASELFLPAVHREGQPCMSFRTLDCGEGQFCSFEARAICGAANAEGRCAYAPEICPAILQLVCGCDGVTHASPCEAAQERTSVASYGACPSS